MTYEFSDPFLSKRCTEARIAAAEADVAAIPNNNFPDFWQRKLVVLRTYIIACLDNQSEAGDLYAEKLAHYTKEYDRALTQARAAAVVQPDGKPVSLLSIPILRG